MRKLLCAGVLFLGLLRAAESLGGEARPVWIDTDLSLGAPWREVDDAYALLLALRAPQLRVVGISSTYGNAPLAVTTRRTRESLGAFGSKLMVAPGAASPNESERASDATEALSAALRRERLTYVALGPLTNLAAFLQTHPGLAKRITQIIMLAGKTPTATIGFGPQEKFRIHDANLVKDPNAVRVVLQSRIPVLLVPIETASRLMLERGDLRALESSGEAGRYLARRSRVWLWFWTQYVKARGGPIFDALAVAAAAKPSLLTIEAQSASFDANGQLIVRRNGEWKVDVCTGFAAGTKEWILQRLTDRKAKSSSGPPDR